MPIGMAQQQGNMVRVFDEKNRHLFSKSGELHGYTSTTVTVKEGSSLRMYDEKGRHVGSRHV